MRSLALAVVAVALLSGCGKRQASTGEWPAGTVETAVEPKAQSKVVVRPEMGLVGKVASANVTARFVVLNFPVGRMPTVEQRLQVYRGGLKVGELKVTGPQLDDAIVADVTAGEANAGDEVREQ